MQGKSAINIFFETIQFRQVHELFKKKSFTMYKNIKGRPVKCKKLIIEVMRPDQSS